MPRTNVENILAQIDASGRHLFKGLISKDKLMLPEGAMASFLDGGLGWGELSEWGVPMGCGGREVIAQLLAHATQNKHWCLWVNSKSQVEVYPPAWESRGVDMSRVRFAETNQPVSDLKPVFMDPFFQFIVLDNPRTLSEDDLSFISRRAKSQRQIVLVLRNYFLSEKRGNVWAKLRVNIWRPDLASQLSLRIIKGLSPRQITLSSDFLDGRDISPSSEQMHLHAGAASYS